MSNTVDTPRKIRTEACPLGLIMEVTGDLDDGSFVGVMEKKPDYRGLKREKEQLINVHNKNRKSPFCNDPGNN